MSLFGIARGLGVLGLQVWDAASFILRPEKPFFEPRDGADWLAEMEAGYEVTEPDCGMGAAAGPYFYPGFDGPTPPDTTRYPETNEVNGPENEGGCDGYCVDCGSGCPYEIQVLVAPLTPDEITAVRRLLQSSAPPASRTAVEQADGPEGGPLSPPPSGHLLTLGNDPAAMYARSLRDRLNEDRQPQADQR